MHDTDMRMVSVSLPNLKQESKYIYYTKMSKHLVLSLWCYREPICFLKLFQLVEACGAVTWHAE